MFNDKLKQKGYSFEGNTDSGSRKAEKGDMRNEGNLMEADYEMGGIRSR